MTWLLVLLLAIEPPPLAEATAPAVRLDPVVAEVEWSTDSHAGRCVGMEPLLHRYSPGWDVARMSRIMYRESRCQPEVKNRRSSATGLLQILASHCRWLAEQMDEWCSMERLRDPVYNVRAGAVLWSEQGYRAWAL